MSVAYEFGRFARSLGIVIVFTIVGPLVVSAVFAIVIASVGISLLQLLLEFFELETLRPWLSIAATLLFFFIMVAAVAPAIITGLAFAIASVYWGMNSLWVAFAIVAMIVLGVVVAGFFLSPSESSPLLLPSVQGLRQGFWLALFLMVPAALAASICWIFTRPLHRMS